jgi:hypothetical protein
MALRQIEAHLAKLVEERRVEPAGEGEWRLREQAGCSGDL